MTIKRRTPKPRRKVPLSIFTCARQRCDRPIRWHGLCAQHAQREADRLFSLFIRRRDGICQVCRRESTNLQCAHLISRRYYALRWNPQNAVAADFHCHLRMTHDPLAWDAWCREYVGSDEWDAMKFRAQRGGKPDLGVVIDEMRLLLEEAS